MKWSVSDQTQNHRKVMIDLGYNFWKNESVFRKVIFFFVPFGRSLIFQISADSEEFWNLWVNFRASFWSFWCIYFRSLFCLWSFWEFEWKHKSGPFVCLFQDRKSFFDDTFLNMTATQGHSTSLKLIYSHVEAPVFTHRWSQILKNH